ncbi:TadE/TadG family type IV pilus assembly protein [Kocuria rhizophila]|uniref:TadE/TadG family type IV pilus assembly protein n=1 Tax=Kocuria rhizophila TaxID=72000 RepID=UPI00064DCA19|nr:TadE/TadG family type IV pilus assembly protein [Kocuria rhizophila]KMK72944.1 pilus assembly protein TadE [Kocuria rhizophila]MCG7424716.1 pilus assembly protein [Kocuria rhizophila]MCT1917836.1 pilus assembly protein [Kocuria rhizophila]MDA4828190.1 TadE/TadG family type IV pilus assembly protein [Kocuria rhizophila]MDN3226331.1 TadE/TadG family type IV pilus assembly protein [Kocuria rhizophila]
MPSTASRDSEGSCDPDAGNAVAEYVMVLALAVVLFGMILQLGFTLHVRNTLIDAAAAGARYASLADRTDADGAERTRAIITDAVGAGYAQNITVSRTGVGELPAIEVHVVAPLPVVATLGPADALEVSGHAVDMDA